jgi:hypothetical protein
MVLFILLLARYLLGLLIDSEDGGSLSLRNVSKLLPDYTASSKKTVHFVISPINVTRHMLQFFVFAFADGELVSVDDQNSRRASSRGLIPKAKIKTIKMTFVIVFGKTR